MSIVRAPRPKGNFYILDKRISEDSGLSWGARGMLIFLLGKPDNWRVSIQNLVNETAQSRKKSGRDAVYAFLAELREAGYVTLIQNRGENGAFGETDYLVHEHSEPLTENPEAGQPFTDFPDTAPPETVTPETDTPHTANTTLLSTQVQQSITTATTTSAYVASPMQSSSSRFPTKPPELQFDDSDKANISPTDVVAIKPIICKWVSEHPAGRGVQDWIFYYAAAARFEAARSTPIQRPAAFMQAVMRNPVQDWTQADQIRDAIAAARNAKLAADCHAQALREDANQVINTMAHFYELASVQQQEVVARFKQENPSWAKYELKSKVFQHALAKWLGEVSWAPGVGGSVAQAAGGHASTA